MIELIQLPYSPYCIVIRRILEYAGLRFKITNILNSDRSLVWRATKGSYYHVPILRVGKEAIFETEHDSQVIARYLESELSLGLFPAEWEGWQEILWRYVENDVEYHTFRLNDVHWKEFVPATDQAGFVRHKERKFGMGCLEQWADDQKVILQSLTKALDPLDRMSKGHPYLLDDQPRFIDFDLYGVLGNFLFTGHYRLPRELPGLRRWHLRMSQLEARTS